MGDTKANNLCKQISTLFTAIGTGNSSMQAGQTGTCARDPAHPTNVSVSMPGCTCAIAHVRHVSAVPPGEVYFLCVTTHWDTVGVNAPHTMGYGAHSLNAPPSEANSGSA